MITHPEGDEYEDVQELIDDLEMGLEVEFGYDGKEWAIRPQVGNYCIYEKDNEASYQEYPTIKEMLDGYKFDGKPLRDVATEIRVTWH